MKSTGLVIFIVIVVIPIGIVIYREIIKYIFNK